MQKKKAERENQGLIEFAIPKVHSNEWFTYPARHNGQFALAPPLNHDWWQDFPTLISQNIPPAPNDWRDFRVQQVNNMQPPAYNLDEKQQRIGQFLED